jgi:HPt (histidine-containing phosphotransfer) domain-containing protein
VDNNENVLAAFARADIEGMDLAAGAGRFGGNAKLYLRVLGTFADSMGAHIDRLNELATEAALADYMIEVHGVKGSCYGVGANKEGDMAKELELSAKAGDFAKVSSGNPVFASAVHALIPKIREIIEAAGESGAGGRKAAPDKAALAAMLAASREFDAAGMQDALRELEKYEYKAGGDLVKWLGEQVASFGYDRIQERLEGIL